MDILIDRRKYKKIVLLHFFMLVMFAIFLFFFYPAVAEGRQSKTPIYVVSVFMGIQSIAMLYRSVKIIQLKSSGLPAMSLQYGHLTDNTQLLFKVKDLNIQDIQSIEKLRDSKNKLIRYKITLLPERIEGGFIARLISKRIVINDLLVDSGELAELVLKIDYEISGHLKSSSTDIRL